METTLDRRAAQGRRLSLQVAVALGAGGEQTRVDADAVNLSRGGLSVRSEDLPEIGSRMRCRFETVPGGTEIDAESEVVWTRDGGDGGECGSFGLRFVDLDPGASGLIEEMLAERLAHSAAGINAPDADATLELGPSGTAIQTRVARRGRRTARFEQRLDLLELGRALLVREQGHRGRQGNISGVSLRLQDGTPMLSVNVDFDHELSFGEFQWSSADQAAAVDTGTSVDGPDTVPDLHTPAVDEGRTPGQITLTEFDAVLPHLTQEGADGEQLVPPPSVAGTADALGLVDAREHGATEEAAALAPRPSVHAEQSDDAALHASGASARADDFGPEVTVSSSVDHASPDALRGSQAGTVPGAEPQRRSDSSAGVLGLGDVEDGTEGWSAVQEPAEHAHPHADEDSDPAADARALSQLGHGSGVGIDGAPVTPTCDEEWGDAAGSDAGAGPAGAPDWSRQLSALVATAARWTARVQSQLRPLAQQAGEGARGLAGDFGRRRVQSLVATLLLVLKPKPRRRTTAGPTRTVGRPKVSRSARSGLPRMLALSTLGAGVVGLGVYALAPAEAPVVESLHRPIAAAAPAPALSDAPAAVQPAAGAGTPAVPAPASVPAASPYAVDVNVKRGAAAAAAGALAVPAVAGPPLFGEAELDGRSFVLRMTAPVKSLRGVADAGGFTVHVPGALSLDRAGPIAAAFPQIRRSMILNKGDHAELTIRFAADKQPAYRVRGRGKEIELTFGK